VPVPVPLKRNGYAKDDDAGTDRYDRAKQSRRFSAIEDGWSLARKLGGDEPGLSGTGQGSLDAGEQVRHCHRLVEAMTNAHSKQLGQVRRVRGPRANHDG
jgi:hypothetical protein